jgi:Tfp pilus assembly protein PilO
VPVKQKNMIVGALAAVFVLILWYMFLYSPMTAQKSKAKKAAADAMTKVKSLELEVNSFKANLASPAQKQQSQKLNAAIPLLPAEAGFFRDLDGIKSASGVLFQAVTPSSPASAGQLTTINVSITVSGSLAQVQDYLTRLEGLSRLFVIDNLSLTPTSSSSGSSAGSAATPAPQGGPTGKYFAGTGAAPTISAQISGRMFTQQVIAPLAGSPGALSQSSSSGSGTATTPSH